MIAAANNREGREFPFIFFMGRLSEKSGLGQLRPLAVQYIGINATRHPDRWPMPVINETPTKK
jgi:hypothetical protein